MEIDPTGNDRRFLRTTGLMALVIGSVASVALLLRVGRNNKSELLLVLFTTWVLGPFLALGLADLLRRRWRVIDNNALSYVMLITAVGCLTVYVIDAFMPPHPQPAFVFVLVPPLAGLFIVIVLGIAGAITSRKR